jgi:hypothetical protein
VLLVEPAVIKKKPFAIGVADNFVPSLAAKVTFLLGIGRLSGRVLDFNPGIGGQFGKVRRLASGHGHQDGDGADKTHAVVLQRLLRSQADCNHGWHG